MMVYLAQTRLKVHSGNGFLGKVYRLFSSSASSSPTSGVLLSSEILAPSLHRSAPWLMLPPKISGATGDKVDCFYSMTDKQVVKINRKKRLGVPEEARCIASARGWLGFIDPNNCSLYLTNPFYFYRHPKIPGPPPTSVIQLPSIETLPSVMGVRYKPGSKSIQQFMMVDPDDESLWTHKYIDPDSLSRYFIKHLTLSSQPFSDKGDQDEDCIAMAVQGEVDRLAFCRVGRDEAWTSIFGSAISSPQTVGFLNDSINRSTKDDNNQFYSMFTNMFGHRGIEAWKISKPWGTPHVIAHFIYQESSQNLHDEFKIETSERDLRNRCNAKHYLVVDESSESQDIMLIIKHTAPHVAEDGTIIDKCTIIPQTIPYKTLRFDVYKVDTEKQKLDHVKFLDDRAIFLGLNQSFILPAFEFPGLRPNSIYFTDDFCESIWSVELSYGGHDLGIYNLEDDSIEPCYPFADKLDKSKKIQPPLLWVAPNSS